MVPLRAVTMLLPLALAGCPADQPPEQQPDPSLAVLDRLAEKEERGGDTDLAGCLARAERTTVCPPGAVGGRRVPLRIALDPLYADHWPQWRERLATTLDCVNRLYRDVGTSWMVQSVEAWDPGAERHDLRALLRRIQRDYPPDLHSVLVGISLWDERRIYAQAGGEIGLSQRAACVVPSWPRIENDCLTLAHELGHIMGARHVPGKQYIMAWAGHMFHLPAADAVGRVVATHRFDPRNTAVMQIYQRAIFTPHGLAIPTGCRERIALFDRCWNL